MSSDSYVLLPLRLLHAPVGESWPGLASEECSNRARFVADEVPFLQSVTADFTKEPARLIAPGAVQERAQEELPPDRRNQALGRSSRNFGGFDQHPRASDIAASGSVAGGRPVDDDGPVGA